MFHRTKGWNSSLEMKSFFIDRSDGWWPQNSENHEPHLACPAGTNYYHYRLQLFGKDLHISRARDSFDCSHFTCEHMRQKEEKQQRDLTTTSEGRSAVVGAQQVSGLFIWKISHLFTQQVFLFSFLIRNRTARQRRKNFLIKTSGKKLKSRNAKIFSPSSTPRAVWSA